MKALKFVLREWQQIALDKLNEYWDKGGLKALLAACPGSGKTVFGVKVAIDLFNAGICNLVILVAPTTNVKNQWSEEFKDHGFDVIRDLDNDTIKKRSKVDGKSIREKKEVICVTYSQLAQALPKLPNEGFIFSLYGQRYKLLFIADEIHHADDEEQFGEAVARTAEFATKTLALSGTPFNSKGGSLTMCDINNTVDDDGRGILKAVPFHDYSYADALRDQVCRQVEFGVVYGKAKTEYKSLATGETFSKLIDLAKENKTDSLTRLVGRDGEFIDTLLSDGIDSLVQIKKKHSDAGMLIAAQTKVHAAEIKIRIDEMLRERKLKYTTLTIVNDTPGAHDRIAKLNSDGTDIVITIKMISEGVDVKRLRVGVYAINYLTRMFFIQFAGRFIRWQNELNASQFSRIIIPAHVLLMEYAREIEQMCLDSVLSPEGEGDGPSDAANVEIDTDTEANDKAKIARGEDASESEINIVDAFKHDNPDVGTDISDFDLGEILMAASYEESQRKKADASSNDKVPKYSQKWWRNKNQSSIQSLARHLKSNGAYPGDIYSKLQIIANNHVGISEVDPLVPIPVLKKRHEFIKQLITKAIFQNYKMGDL